MTDTTDSPYGRAKCAVCGRPMNLLRDGTIRKHASDRLDRGGSRVGKCDGSGEKPALRKAQAAAGANTTTEGN